ncbi:hypothetical protein [uncultured Stenotrophomonas sp.]|uniref:hypothetical protein n=1 Tax=uncultured Stenotrophomonas sp. TaxID=165438 RepID=UPI0028D18859|nr:hypothetical protein [uncultured Stenotrophomonas sp.]
MFNSPGWAALIDVKTAAGVAGAVSRSRLLAYTPISQYQDLHARHRALVELLGWMSPDARAHVGAICRFNAVHADRLRLATPDSPCISELPTVI